jgi:hypothetical protein
LEFDKITSSTTSHQKSQAAERVFACCFPLWCPPQENVKFVITRHLEPSTNPLGRLRCSQSGNPRPTPVYYKKPPASTAQVAFTMCVPNELRFDVLYAICGLAPGFALLPSAIIPARCAVSFILLALRESTEIGNEIVLELNKGLQRIVPS